MDRAIKIGPCPPIRRLAAPGMPDDRARRQIDATPVGLVAGHVRYVGGADMAREVPSAHGRQRNVERMREAGELVSPEHAAIHRRGLDLSVEMRGDADSRIVPGGDQGSTCRQRRHAHVYRSILYCVMLDAMRATDRPLQDPNFCRRIEACHQQVPRAFPHGSYRTSPGPRVLRREARVRRDRTHPSSAPRLWRTGAGGSGCIAPLPCRPRSASPAPPT